jgi:hypothetical protein
MQIHYIHSYCGGRLLTGLYNPQAASLTPGYVWEKCAKNWTTPWDGNYAKGDPCYNLPGDFVEFLQILKKFTYHKLGKDGYQGMILAVTNSAQTVASQRYLPDAGFKNIGSHGKHHASPKCITWIADYRNDVYPILEKVPDYSEVKREAKFAKISEPVAVQPRATGSIPATPEYTHMEYPAPRPQPSVQDTIRDRAFQAFSTSTRR